MTSRQKGETMSEIKVDTKIDGSPASMSPVRLAPHLFEFFKDDPMGIYTMMRDDEDRLWVEAQRNGRTIEEQIEYERKSDE